MWLPPVRRLKLEASSDHLRVLFSLLDIPRPTDERTSAELQTRFMETSVPLFVRRHTRLGFGGALNLSRSHLRSEYCPLSFALPPRVKMLRLE